MNVELVALPFTLSGVTNALKTADKTSIAHVDVPTRVSSSSGLGSPGSVPQCEDDCNPHGTEDLVDGDVHVQLLDLVRIQARSKSHADGQ